MYTFLILIQVNVYFSFIINLVLSSIIDEVNKTAFFFHKIYFKPKKHKTITFN